MLREHVHGAQGAAFLVAMRGVDHDRQLEFLRELDLRPQILVLERRLLVVADLADGDDAVLGGEMRQHVHDRFGQLLVVGFLRVQADTTVVADAELAGAEFLEADDGREIVDVAAEIGARLADPEGGLDHGDDAGARHRLVVVGRARDHVRVRIDDHRVRRQRYRLGLDAGGAVGVVQREPRAAAGAGEARTRSAIAATIAARIVHGLVLPLEFATRQRH